MVNSEMIISEKAEKVLHDSVNKLIDEWKFGNEAYLKTPCLSALNAPQPAAAEKFPRSMIPLDKKTLYWDVNMWAHQTIKVR